MITFTMVVQYVERVVIVSVLRQSCRSLVVSADVSVLCDSRTISKRTVIERKRAWMPHLSKFYHSHHVWLESSPRSYKGLRVTGSFQWMGLLTLGIET